MSGVQEAVALKGPVSRGQSSGDNVGEEAGSVGWLPLLEWELWSCCHEGFAGAARSPEFG